MEKIACLLRPPAAHISYLVGKYMASLRPFAWENIVCTFRQIFFVGLPRLVYSFHPEVNEINRFREGGFPPPEMRGENRFCRLRIFCSLIRSAPT